MVKSQPLLVRNWKQDIVNLVQFPRTKVIPSPSPFALKLETWLRLAKLNYANVSNNLTEMSSKGQIPFIELNGRQFADSNFIIEHLIQQYSVPVDRSLTTRERAEARAISVLVEESLARVVMYDRSRNPKWLFTDQKGFLGNIRGAKKQVIHHVGPIKFQFDIKRTVYAQGIGRHTPDEVDEIAKKDLATLSVFLGDKRYFFGDRPTTVDTTVFGTLAQLLYAPLNSDKIKPFLEVSTPNLVEFATRLRDELWPDWTAVTDGLNLNSHLPAATTSGAPPTVTAESVLHATASNQ